MAKFELLIKHVKTWEGSHGADPRDNALKSGHSGVLGKEINPRTKKPYDAKFPNNFIHTSSGITWSTYILYCKEKKKAPSSSEFLQMNVNIWNDIYKTLFWDKILGDKINSQGIAENLVEARFVGGSQSLIRDLIKYMNITYNLKLSMVNYVSMPLVNALNKYIITQSRYKKVLDYLYNSRLNYYKSLNDWKVYGKGWTNRLNSLYERSIKYPPTGGNILNLPNIIQYFKIFGLGAVFFF